MTNVSVISDGVGLSDKFACMDANAKCPSAERVRLRHEIGAVRDSDLQNSLQLLH
jgi:hypothetical protein